MPIENIVADASPLILFAKSELDELLASLFQPVVVPSAVFAEVLAGDDAASAMIERADWIERVEVEIPPEISSWNLGLGESEVLAFARSNPTFRASIDDRAARACAATLSIRTLGTAGILALAKRRGLIPSFKSSLTELRSAGLYISSDLFDALVRKAGE